MGCLRYGWIKGDMPSGARLRLNLSPMLALFAAAAIPLPYFAILRCLPRR